MKRPDLSAIFGSARPNRRQPRGRPGLCESDEGPPETGCDDGGRYLGACVRHDNDADTCGVWSVAAKNFCLPRTKPSLLSSFPTLMEDADVRAD